MSRIKNLIIGLIILNFSVNAYAYEPKAAQISVTPAGNISSTTVQAALQELDTKKQAANLTGALTFTIDGRGGIIVAGSSGSKPVPYNCTVTRWEITSNVSGSAVIDIKRSTYTGYPTFTSIAGTEKPTLSAQQKNKDGNLTTWTATLTAGDRLQAYVDSADVDGVIQVTVYLTRT